MGSEENNLLPKLDRTLIEMGENIKLARLRRKLSTAQVAERAGISRTTLYAIEKSSYAVRIGAYVKVLHVLGLEKDFLSISKDDVLGRKLQDYWLSSKKTCSKKKLK